MADFSWLSIFGAVTGAVGAISGLVGSVLGYKGYRRAQDVKALDLRLELRKAVSDARATIGRLPGLMNDANESRQALLTARGLRGGHPMTVWTTSWDADQEKVVALKDELSELDKDYTAMTDHAKLESCLVSMHDLTRRATDMRTKYEGEIASDDKLRDRRAVELAPWVLKH